MTSRRAIALARAVNALFFLTISAYCFLSSTPFAYDVFIKPGVVPALTHFIVASPIVFWVALLVSMTTLLPQLGPAGRALGPSKAWPASAGARIFAWSYVLAGLAAGVPLLVEPPLAGIGNTLKAFALGMAALASPVWLALIDHSIWPAPKLQRASARRVLVASIWSAVVACGGFAVAAALRSQTTVGVALPPGRFLAAVGSSFVLDLYVFMVLFLAIAALIALAKVSGGGASAEYRLLLLLMVVGVVTVLYVLVCASLAFTGVKALVASIGLAVALVAVWADLARLRCGSPSGPSPAPAPIDSIALFAAPVIGVGSRRASAAVVLAAVPIVAYVCVDAVRQFDWNFLLQKMVVLIVWLLTFISAYTMVGSRRQVPESSAWCFGLAPLLALVLFYLIAWLNPQTAIDSYAAVDPSLRLIRDARVAHSSATADYYAWLRTQTLLTPEIVASPEIDFVQPLRAAAERPPDLFLIVVDSLRSDYLSAYNSHVTFTPELGKLAADSFVYERAWSRYSGTALSVPAIWTGGLVPHTIRQPAFARRNTLMKLLAANNYLRLMDMDSVGETLGLRDAGIVELNPGTSLTVDVDLCRTFDVLQRQMPKDRARPVFFYSLPQNVHMGVASRRTIPAGEAYPGFDRRIASSLHRLDRCIGEFVDFLKSEHRYDDSIIILTADHGDLLGEAGRWGHAFWIYPETMKVPLIVHVPTRLRAKFQTDLASAAFTIDITPSLYALLGYAPADRGPLFGKPLFTARDDKLSHNRREPSLLASSYGAVYGLMRQNGRRLYVADTVDGAEFAVDVTAAQPVTMTPSMTDDNRRIMAQQLEALATLYYPTATRTKR